jgi:Na+/H+-dicarboxylate symporter/ABC-type amino acid transport substrate-binding protein
MSASNQIVAGLVGGVLTGLFLGERALALQWIADGFVKLLQMTVLPYVTVSILRSLGSLSLTEARTLGLRAGAVLAGLWSLALVFTFLIPLVFPTIESASFFSTTVLNRPTPFNFVDLYIPANPFYSLANNVVPAVVLFSVIFGVALIGVERKQVLIDVLTVASNTISSATRFVVRFTPYGLFAIAAVAAGTLSLEQLERLQVYLVAYVAVALLVALWVLPGLVAALTPIPYGAIFSSTRDALLTAFVAGDLFIVLPALIEASQGLVRAHVSTDPEAASLPNIVVPASFNFPHTGKLLSLSFVMFAGWFADADVPVAEYPRLAFTGLVTFFGSLNAAVPFLLDLFRIPADTFQLFLATGVINSRIGTLVAAVHTLTVALLGTCAIAGAITWRHTSLVRYAVTTAALTTAVVGGTRAFAANVLATPYTRDQVLASMHLQHDGGRAIVHRTEAPMPADAPGLPVLDAVRARGTLRVGYVSDGLPFVFFNGKDQLVGLDVDLAHRLAAELGVGLEFVPLDRQRLIGQLAEGYCDLAMAGLPVTTDRASEMVFSEAYLDETLGLVVPDHAREGFASWDRIAAGGPLTILVPNVPYYVAKLRERLPRARVRTVDDLAATFANPPDDMAAIALPAERGSAWTLLYPRYSVVVPEPDLVKIPLAYPVARNDQRFANFLSLWIDLKRKDGTIQGLYNYWILGRDPSPRTPRWSIIRDVLHWVE